MITDRRPPVRPAHLERLERTARLLDSAFRIPGTSIRFGLDGLLGLVPGAGDLVGFILSSWIVREAYRLGVPASAIMGMLGNIGVDAVVGSIPILGSIFDVAWKANHRNLAILRRHTGG